MERLISAFETTFETLAAVLGLALLAVGVLIAGVVVDAVAHLGLGPAFLGSLFEPAAGFGYFVLPLLCAAVTGSLGFYLTRWAGRRLGRRFLATLS